MAIKPNINGKKYSLAGNLAALVAFAAMIFVLLVSRYGNYMREVAELSIFVPGADYFAECMRTPGGLVVWISTFLTATFSHSLLGAGIYAALCLVFMLLAVKAFRLPRTMWAATVLPVAAAVLCLLTPGYIIFSMKAPGWAFSTVVGIITVELVYMVYSRLPWWWLRAIAMAVVVVVGYPYLGFYALLAAATAAMGDLGEILCALIHRRPAKWLFAVPVAIAVICIWLVPDVYFASFANDLTLGHQWIAPLPRFMADEGSLNIPYMVLAVSVCLLAFIACKEGRGAACDNKKAFIAALACAAAIYIGSIVWIFAGRFTDTNFNITLDLKAAIHDGDFAKATEWWTTTEEPTRINVVLTHAALLGSGAAPEMIFRTPHGNAEYATTPERAVRLLHEAGAPTILNFLGFNRFAYRMAMEEMVEHGVSVEQLKLLAKNAIANGDTAVARKYLATLGQVPFQKAWANRYTAYIDGTPDEQLAAEMRRLADLKIDENTFILDNGRFETYVWPYLAGTTTDTPAALDRAMVAALMDQNLDRFKELLDKYMQIHSQLPLHYQEGILAYSLANSSEDYQNYPIAPEVLARYQKFVKLLESSGRMSEEMLFRNTLIDFGDTYWFYYMYKPRLGII